jgi:prepilin-type processing-associated H-X9-DG protein
MQPDLLGYVLNALDAPARAEVDAYLQGHPEAQAQLTALRQALEPLSWDATGAPPPRLAERTLQRVAAFQPHSPSGVRRLPGRRFLEVAAALFIVATAAGVGITWLGGIRGQRPGAEANPSALVLCKENLHKVFVALGTYADAHNRQFPDVAAAAKAPRNGGNLVFSILYDGNLLPADVKLACPGTAASSPNPISLGDVQALSDKAYQGWAQSMQNGYAYSVGYQQDGKFVAPRLEEGKPNTQLPLLADNSPLDPLQPGQSQNHGGCGQNVLYCDGHVAFCPTRFVGYNQDDIYLNRANKIAAGVDWSDTVLTGGVVPP